MRFVSGSPCWARTNLRGSIVHMRILKKLHCNADFP
nr:MAG TPA: hypothetical protein [Caudoviricetes sp.]